MHWYKNIVHKVGIFATLKPDPHRKVLQKHISESIDYLTVAVNNRLKLNVDDSGRLHDLELKKEHLRILKSTFALLCGKTN